MFEINERITHLQTADCQSPLSFPLEVIIIVVCCLLGIIWAVVNILAVEQINVKTGNIGDGRKSVGGVTQEQENLLLELGHKISEVLVRVFRALRNS